MPGLSLLASPSTCIGIVLRVMILADLARKKLKSNYSWVSNNVLRIPNAISILNILMFGIGMFAFGMVGVYSYSYGKLTMAALA